MSTNVESLRTLAQSQIDSLKEIVQTTPIQVFTPGHLVNMLDLAFSAGRAHGAAELTMKVQQAETKGEGGGQ